MRTRTPSHVYDRPFTAEEVQLLRDHDAGDFKLTPTRRDPDGAQTALATLRLTQAYVASRLHSQMAETFIAAYGDGNGDQISGSVRDHFPTEVKDALREVARSVTKCLSDSREAWRRAGRTHATWMREKEQTIARDGRGFYG